MMTTMAALMGTLPIALGWGAGAEARRPLGLAVVGALVAVLLGGCPLGEPLTTHHGEAPDRVI